MESSNESFFCEKIIGFQIHNSKSYISDIQNILMADVANISSLPSNLFFQETCQLLVNSIHLMELGYFDCAFYSLRQSLELSVGTIFLNVNPSKMQQWNTQKRGFELGKMCNYLIAKEPYFKDIREKLNDFFDEVYAQKILIDKYVHKQGYRTFYGMNKSSLSGDKNLNQILRDFIKTLDLTIGAVAVYRLVIDPMPIILMDEDMLFCTGDLLTESYSERFVRQYMGVEVLEKFKQTQIYLDYRNYFKHNDKQNEGTFLLIHYQIVNRKKIKEILSQIELCQVPDRVAVCLMLVSDIYINGDFWYSSDVKSLEEYSNTIGHSYYENLFTDFKNDFNNPFHRVYLSRCKYGGNIHYIKHNFPLTPNEQLELNMVAQFFDPILQKYNAQINQFMDRMF